MLDVPVKLSVVLGSTRVSIDELLRLRSGSVVKLEKLAGEPLDVYVGDKLVARGEAVVVNGSFGIRITDVLNKAG